MEHQGLTRHNGKAQATCIVHRASPHIVDGTRVGTTRQQVRCGTALAPEHGGVEGGVALRIQHLQQRPTVLHQHLAQLDRAMHGGSMQRGPALRSSIQDNRAHEVLTNLKQQ
jgi:hypothetical protein